MTKTYNGTQTKRIERAPASVVEALTRLEASILEETTAGRQEALQDGSVAQSGSSAALKQRAS